MSKLKIILSAAVLAISFSSCKNEQQKESVIANNTENTSGVVAKSETASFSISGMSCAVMCANKIEKELATTKGVQKAKVDFEKKLATVTFDSEVVTAQQLVEKVEAVAGGKLYKVTNLKTSADKAMLSGDSEREKKAAARKAARAERKAAREAAKNPVVEAKAKSGCCSAAKSCSKSEKSGTL